MSLTLMPIGELQLCGYTGSPLQCYHFVDVVHRLNLLLLYCPLLADQADLLCGVYC